jgi:uncharacterized protein (DUF885 family)
MSLRGVSVPITRRDFLRMLLISSGSLTLSPLLKACSRATIEPAASQVPASATPPVVPTTPSTPPGLLGGLDGLPIDDFFEEAYRLWLMRDPENLTVLGLADLYGVGDGKLTDISDVTIRETQALEIGTLNLLRSYKRAAFTTAQALTADIYEWFLDDLVRGHPFMYDDYPVNPTVTSIPYNLYMLLTDWHPLNNRQDAGDYIARLSQVGTKMAQLIDNLKLRQERGVILPSFLIPVVSDDINRVAYNTPPTHPFYEAFSKHLTGIPEEERQNLLERVKTQITEVVCPAYQGLSGFLKDLQSRAPGQVGVWQFPDGEAFYAQCLRRHTTTGMTAMEIHELGLQNVARIHAEMRPLFTDLGYPGDASIPDLISRLTQDSGVYYGSQAVEAYQAAIREVRERLPEAFDILPKAEVSVVGGPDGDYYVQPSYDGTRPGLFYASTNGGTPKFGVKTLAFHETIPGHHLQIAIAMEQPGLPSLRKGMQFNAYTEGWALYAERLMWELGAYANDPQGNLGRLRAEAYRAARLVVDTGIHAMKWDFDQAVDYLTEAAGLTYAQGEIARYSVWPGQAVSYYIGFLKILELRQMAVDALGSRFDLKAFHHVLLVNGSVPLSILNNLVETYLRGD